MKKLNLFISVLLTVCLCGCGTSEKAETASFDTGVVAPTESLFEVPVYGETPSEGTSDGEEEIAEEITPTESPEEPTFDIVLSFTGDNMLAEYKNGRTENGFNAHTDNNPPSYFMEKVAHYFLEDDFTVINLENVFTDRNLPCRIKDEDPAYFYCSSTKNTEILTSSGIEIANCCNNHIRDYGYDGMNDTFDALEAAGVSKNFNEITYYEKNGFKIALMCVALWVSGQESSGITLLEEAKENSDFQIIYFHGDSMYKHAPSEVVKNGCHRFVDNGADLVIGCHPHVLQPVEIYNEVPIVYSLGNFCYGGSKKPENRTIIYQYKIIVDKETLTVTGTEENIVPCYVYTGESNNYQPAEIEDEEERLAVLDFMAGKREKPF